MIKVLYCRSFHGFNIYSTAMHPLSNMYVDMPDYDIDKFKAEMKKRFGTEDIEFEEDKIGLLLM
jgi:hypothetical protein